MTFPCKDLSFFDNKFRVYGLSENDQYFRTLHDNMEPEFVRFCQGFIRPHYSCLDVGANIGLKSLIMAAQARDGRVVAIEPGPKVGELLELNVRSNGAANIVIEKAAVGNRADGATARFHEDSAYGHFNETGVEVPVTTLAALSRKHGLARVDFIKMDVEGSEFCVLKDSIEFINANETLVYLEFSVWTQIVNAETHPKEFAKWLLESFSHVFLVNKFADHGKILSRIAADDWFGILQHNCFTAAFVDDIVATNAPWRLDTAEAERHVALVQRDAAIAGRDAAIAERDAAIAERDAALAQIAALQNSTSWKLTSGVRGIGKFLRSRP